MRKRFHFVLLALLTLGLFTQFVPAEENAAISPGVLAHIKLSGGMDEGVPGADPLFGAASETLKTKLDRIAKAKKDKSVQALYLQVEGMGVGYGKMNELRHALADFRKSGKKIYAYLEEGSTMDYLAACCCDEIAMPEGGALELVGVQAQITFFKDLLDKLHIKADMMQMGAFKGAGETFTRSSASPENRKQWEELVEDHYQEIIASVAEARKSKGLTPEKVKHLIDQGPFTAKQALANGLIDNISYADTHQDKVAQTSGATKLSLKKDYAKQKAQELDFSNPFALLKLLSPAKEGKLNDKPKVAVIYATGSIVTGKSGKSLMGGESCGSTTIVEAIRKAEEEPSVKAIVLRVDSPGGSALASDLMWHELKKCKKPVVASMGDVAASGGYYISMAAKQIFAEPGTITGSIGVVGGKIVVGGLMDMVGVNTEVVSRGANAGAGSMYTPFSDSERKAMRAVMQEIYDQFLDKSFEGRKHKIASREQLEKLAGGRVWTGRAALANGLVDTLGTLEDAIGAAKEMAGMKKDDETELLLLPKNKGTILDSFLDTGSDSSLKLPAQFQAVQAVPEFRAHLRALEPLFQLRKERVWAIMPYRVEVK